ncbi:MAG: inositol monophosphatase [Desulfobacterales bacterium]|nr:inositol monophosphatase [Desulfobacterales bacterium]
MTFNKINRISISAAKKGAEVLKSYLGRIKKIDKKGAIDLVTEADTGSEQVVIETIRDAFPNHSILAEESGESNRDADHLWIIDPLDGTTNFTHQLGQFCVSIAYAHKGEIVSGTILNPVSDELFHASAGQGATLNGTAIKASSTLAVSESLLVTGFPYNHQTVFNELITRFENCLAASQGVRRLGSAALDLCFVACGRFDGFWEQNLNPWDTAAGIIIAGEAGVKITDFQNRNFSIYKKEVLATNGNIHNEMLSLLELKEKA